MAESCSLDVQTPRNGKTVYIGNDWSPVIYRTQTDGEKTTTVRTGYDIIKRRIDKYGRFLFTNDIEANTWWTNLGMNDHVLLSRRESHGKFVNAVDFFMFTT